MLVTLRSLFLERKYGLREPEDLQDFSHTRVESTGPPEFGDERLEPVAADRPILGRITQSAECSDFPEELLDQNECVIIGEITCRVLEVSRILWNAEKARQTFGLIR